MEGECAKEKKEGLEQLDEERVAKIEAEKKAIRDKFTIGAKDEEEIRQQLIDLMASGKDNYEAVMRQAEMEKNKQNDSLQERLRQRRKANEDKLAAKQADFQQEEANMDIVQIYEQERAADKA